MRACVRWMALGGLVAGLWRAALPASADGVEIRIDAVSTEHLPAATATVTVTDSAGLPLQGLPPDAFTAFVDGQPVPLSSVAGAADQNLGIAVVLTFDVSGSMVGAPIEQARAAGRALISQLGPADQAAVISFADEVRTVQRFTGDKGVLLAAVDSLAAAGNTALYEAVRASYDSVAQSGLPRKAIVLLSDGQDFGAVSLTDRAASLAVAGRPGIAMFIVGLGQLVDQPYLQELAGASRGRLLQATDPASLAGLYETIGALLRQQYVLTLDVSGVQGGPNSTLRLSVAAAGGSAAAEAPLNLPTPPPPPPTVTFAPTPVITPAPAPEPQEEVSGGGVTWAIPAVAGGLIGAGVLGALLVVGRRRRRPGVHPPREVIEESLERIPTPAEHQGREGPLFPPAHVEEVPLADSWLRLREPGGEQRFALGSKPVTIGFTADCDIRLPDGNGMRIERVRVWLRDGRYMIHSVSRLGRVYVGGAPVTWAILEDGDEIQVGPCVLTFESRAKAQG